MNPSAPDVLLEPLEIGGVTAPNRIVFGAHVTNFGQGNRFTDRHRHYYLARAAGGAGVMVTEALTVHPLDRPYEHVPVGESEAILPSLAALAESLKGPAPQLVLLAALNHSGGQNTGKQLRQSPWAPSAVPEVATKRMARAMSAGQIDEVIAGFADAAKRARRAGLDGVELNAGQQSLLRQFLSPLTNFRGDSHGGDLDNRARMLLRTVEAVRGALGPQGVLGVKLCGDELAPWGGLTVEDAAAVANMLAIPGGADYLSIQIGGPYSSHMTEAGMPVPQGHAAHLAASVREAIGGRVPVFAEGRIESLDIARNTLREGQADAVVMTRALISDPDLPRKAAGEDSEPIRPHIGMTRYFSVQGDWNRPLGDLANPRAGREDRLPPLIRRQGAGRVLVIGGGPAGLEAAVTLARPGHEVTLAEAKEALGGMAAVLAREVASRSEFALLAEYYRAMVERLKVRVELNRSIGGWEEEFGEYDAIYLAIGAQPSSAPFRVEDGLVLSPRELWSDGPHPLPKTHGAAVVVDIEYGFRMAAAVEWLLAHGYGVDVVTPDFLVGRGLVESAEFLWFNRVAVEGARFHPRLEAHALEGGILICQDRFSGAERRFGPLDLVVPAVPDVPDPALSAALQAHHPRVVTIGDARAPRLMGEAIQHAHRTVLE